MGGAEALLVSDKQYFCIFKLRVWGELDFFFSFFVPECQDRISTALKKALLSAASGLFDVPLLPPSGKEPLRLKFSRGA